MTWLMKLKELVLGPKAEQPIPREKRIAPRISCFIEAVFTTGENESFEGNIIVLETTGMRLITPVKLEKGQKFLISISSYSEDPAEKTYDVEAVNAEVVWCRKKKDFPLFYAGVRFTDDQAVLRNSWVYFVLESYGASKFDSQRRKEIRVTTILPVKCTLAKRNWLTGISVDLGVGGAKLSLLRDPGEGKEMTLHIGPYKKLPVFKCLARVKRSSYNQQSEEYTVGVEFLDLDAQQLKLVGQYVMILLKEASL